jgi:hypothetical protein
MRKLFNFKYLDHSVSPEEICVGEEASLDFGSLEKGG